MKEEDRHTDLAAPAPVLRLIDAIVLIVGIVIGAGIFRTPSVVAANSPDQFWFIAAWILGGVISLTGALCYSELSAAFPNAGGDYHFLKTAFGKRFSFLFAWSRVTVTQTGSIALLAYIAGDYLAKLLPLGTYSSAFYAAAIVVFLTLVNISGIRFGTGFQKLFMALQIVGILIIVLTGFLVEPTTVQSHVQVADPGISSNASIGLALIFVLLTFGGWNEAAYISAELKTGSRKMAFVLVISILIITLIYLLMNLSFLNVLGLRGMAASEAVGIDMMQATLGERGVILIGLLVSLFALTSLNTTIFTGARANYALGKDFSPLAFLGKWDKKKSSPVNSLILQGLIAVVLIVFGAFTRNGFEAMVDFTAPVFWFFFLCTGLSLFVLRRKQPDVPRPFRVPLYPVIPFLFVALCAYMLYSSLSVTGTGALVGVAVLLVGWGISFFQ
ncbi:MAG: amino acid permease [Proteiniphilum sp.]|jgi:APA family basic amino acid/polyamine antiporter|uniref:APC family permease n=1 Tax=Proteiniphilum sp. TaxID=1926877 RepID=UPI002B20B2E1|nr:amino acid permease [Proteiniphilum sp.]MEA5129749.1 amino acid permease [Proteiniphilum sp.]